MAVDKGLKDEAQERREYRDKANQKGREIAGLEADDIANTLYEQNASGEGDSAFWEQSAARMLRASATVLEVLHERDPKGWPWTLGALYRLACTKEGTQAAMESVDPEEAEGLSAHHKRAVSYRFKEYPGLPDKMRGSIDGYVQSCLSSMVDTELH